MTHIWGRATAAVCVLTAGVRGHLVHLSPARHPRIWLAAVIVRAMLVTPAPFAAETTAAAPPSAAAKASAVPMQALAVEDVLIEGKLYSPQALYIVSRNLESFDRAVIIPHYLAFEPTTRFVPYRVRAELLGRAAVSPRTAASDSTAVSP